MIFQYDLPVYKGEIVPYHGVLVPERNYREYADCIASLKICETPPDLHSGEKTKLWFTGFFVGVVAMLMVGR